MTLEDELVRWLRAKIEDEEKAKQRAAAGHYMSTYDRKVGSLEALRSVFEFVDPLGDKP